jgi:hypothetical protein
MDRTMLRLSTEQRRLVADKVFDGANVAAGALVFGQFLGSGAFSAAMAVAGATLWVAAAVCAIWVTRES